MADKKAWDTERYQGDSMNPKKSNMLKIVISTVLCAETNYLDYLLVCFHYVSSVLIFRSVFLALHVSWLFMVPRTIWMMLFSPRDCPPKHTGWAINHHNRGLECSVLGFSISKNVHLWIHLFLEYGVLNLALEDWEIHLCPLVLILAL